MFSNLVKFYLFFSLFLYSLLIWQESYISTLDYINILAVITYFGIIYYAYKTKLSTKISLIVVILIYSLLYVTLYNLISFILTDNFFIFSTGDAITYDFFAKKILTMNFIDGIKYFLNYYYFDDIGIVLIISSLYRIVESNLILNLFYILVGILTAVSIFNISKNFMSKNYAYITALSYSISSYVLFFHSSGLKESFMVMLVVFSFEQYYSFINTKKIKNLLWLTVFASALILFRPALTVLLFISFSLGLIKIKRKSLLNKTIFMIIIFIMFYFSPFILDIINKYTTGGFDSLIKAKEADNMIKGGLVFTYMVNFLSQIVGPFPTLFSNSELLTIYAPSLIFRVFLSSLFLPGVYYIYIKKYKPLYPILVYIFLEMFSLASLLEGLELRKSISHIPFIYVISFWFLYQYENNRNIKYYKIFFYSLIIILALLIIYWNLR